MSQTYRGIAASPGYALGHAVVLDARRLRTPKVKLRPQDVPAEVERLEQALLRADSQLESIRSRLHVDDPSSTGQDHGLILEAHRLMLHDPMFLGEVQKLIHTEHINAEWAIRRVIKRIKRQFDDMTDEYFRERRSDLDFVADRLVRNLMGQSADVSLDVPPDSIIVAHDISPADAAILVQGGHVAAFVTDLGGHTSHTAIVARARGTPAVLGAGRLSEYVRTGDVVAVDGVNGVVWVNPTDEHLQTLKSAMREHLALEASALRTASLEAATPDGHRVHLNGNIEFPEEIPSLLAHGAEGIGLYRTEFLFLNRASAPTEEEHYRAYRQVLEEMGPRPVTIRTLDLGGDKVPGKKLEKEINPAMGLRAIRYCLQHRELFRVQLRALLRASVHGNLRVMFPLVSGLSELREARSELEYCRSELGRLGHPVGKRFPIGIMVETPSAAWIADRLAEEADFFSVGTNDLIQYTLAIDRQNRDVAYLYRPVHPAVLRSLKHVVDSAKAARIPVAMCGEMAGDVNYSMMLVGLGFDELSMTSGQLLGVKSMIRAIPQSDAVGLVKGALSLYTSEEIERFIKAEVQKYLPAAKMS